LPYIERCSGSSKTRNNKTERTHRFYKLTKKSRRNEQKNAAVDAVLDSASSSYLTNSEMSLVVV